MSGACPFWGKVKRGIVSITNRPYQLRNGSVLDAGSALLCSVRETSRRCAHTHMRSFIYLCSNVGNSKKHFCVSVLVYACRCGDLLLLHPSAEAH